MKIRIKNNVGILNEDATSSNQNQNNTNQQQPQESEVNKSFKEYRKKQYVQDQKVDSLPINIAVPDKLFRRLDVPNSPEDINNLMSTKQVNKARKTRDFKKLGIQDPIATYDHAEDECQKAFGNFFTQSKIKFSDSSKERKFGKVSGSTGKVYNESVNESTLNEVSSVAAAITGAKIGVEAGKLANAGISFCTCGLAGLGAGVAVPLATIAAAAFTTGYALEHVFGNVTPSGPTNDKQSAHLNDERSDMMEAPTAKMPMDYGNVVEALDSYIENTLESVRELVIAITPANESKVDEIDKYVMGLKGAAVKAADQFMENNSQRIKDQLEAAEKKRASRVDKQKNRLEDIKIFSDALEKAFQTSKQDINKQSFKLYGNIKKFFVDNVNNNKGFELIELANEECKDFQKYVAKYNELKKKNNNNEDDVDTNSMNDSLAYKYSSPLYEADANMKTSKDGKPLVDLNAMYENISSELISKFKAAFSGFKPEEMKNYNSTKEHMQFLIDEADKTIKAKIETIAKSSTLPPSQQDNGLTSAAKQFLFGHPLEAQNLTEVWSRHLVDLKSRMSNRLSQMTDSTNSERTLGWTLRFCRVTLPAILTRMLVYRYAYAILSNEGVYNYNEEMLQHDMEEADKLVDTFVQDDTFKLVWLLNTYGLDYTNNGQPFIVAENGEYKLVEGSYLAYVIFLFLKLGRDSNGDIRNAQLVKAYTNLANSIAQANPQDAQSVIQIIYGMLSEKHKQLLSSDEEESIDKLAALFTMSDDFKNVKGDIKNAYDRIINAVNSTTQSLSDADAVYIGKSLEIISKNPENIYTIYTNNKDKDFKTIIKKYKDAEVAKDDKAKKEQINVIRGIFKNINFDVKIKESDFTADIIKSLFVPTQEKMDYYAYILYLCGERNLNKIKGLKDKGPQTPEGVKVVCRVTSELMELALSGLLGYAAEAIDEDNKNEDELNALKDKLINVNKNYINIKNIKDTMANVNSDQYDNIKAEYTKLYDLVKTQIKDSYLTSSKEANYKLSGIVNDELLEAEEKQSWLDQLISKMTEFNDTTDKDALYKNIKTALANAKVSSENSENTIDRFNKLEDKDQNEILSNLSDAMDNAYNNGDVKKLTDDLLEKLKIQGQTITQSLANSIDSIKSITELIINAHDSLNEMTAIAKSNNDNEAETIRTNLFERYSKLYNEVTSKIKAQYDTIVRNGANYKFKDTILDEDPMKKFNKLLTLFKPNDTNPLSGTLGNLGDLEIEATQNNKNEKKATKFGELTSDKDRNDLLNNFASAILTVQNDDNYKSLELLIKAFKDVINEMKAKNRVNKYKNGTIF